MPVRVRAVSEMFPSHLISKPFVTRVWTNHPDIHTSSTVMCKSPLLSLEWAPKPDRLVSQSQASTQAAFIVTLLF